jgi:hypothetical protein
LIPLRRTGALLALAALLVAAPPVAAQSQITSPRQEFGFDIGADYQLVNYSRMVSYWEKLARESDRMELVRIGNTAEGRPMLMAIITSPENHQKLDRYREIARRLALAKDLTDDEARTLAREGKAVVWIDGGLHSTEVLGAQQLIQTVYELVSRTDDEIMRFLRDDIILCVLANPDGMELVSDWYNRHADTLKRSTSHVPRLYQKYAGHDNNRDFFMANQPETQAMNRVMYREWFPLIVYNHHQTGPAGTVMFAPPFRDPFNYNYDPLVPMQLDLVGAAMHSRFIAKGLPGVTMRSGANYSTWWNGGLRTTPYFHNMIGLLTETIGHPTPISIPLVPANQLPRGDMPAPIAPQTTWRFSQSLAYELEANWAVLDVASRYRETLLYNSYVMGRNSIERGSRDNWTTTPRLLDSLEAAVERSRAAHADGSGAARRGAAGIVPSSHYSILRKPEDRDPRAYIIPADQPDFPRAIRFVNVLIKGGVQVERATAPFAVNGKNYPAGSFVVMTAQAFRPHVLDMFEPQDHPHDLAYPGGPPKAPYDITGWTPALQMGVRFDRILDGFTGPLAAVSDTVIPPAGRVAEARNTRGYLLSNEVNNSVIAVNRLMKAGQAVYWLSEPLTLGGATYKAGTIFIPATGSAPRIVQRAAQELGLTFDATTAQLAVQMLRLRPVRLGLWDQYGGSMPSGWIRWLLEQYEFPYQVVYPQELDRGSLARKYDVLVFPSGAIPMRDAGAAGDGGGAAGASSFRGPRAEDIPAEFRDHLGQVTVAKTVPQIRAFLESGGSVLAIGSSTNLAYHLGLPVASALVQQGTDRPLPRERFYIPGSLLSVRVDNTSPLAYGVPDSINVLFSQSPVFRLTSGASSSVTKTAWFDSPTPLRSGWAHGQEHLDQGVAIAEASVGKGKLFLFGPEITFRGQPHASFPFLFNGIYYGPASVSAGKK